MDNLDQNHWSRPASGLVFGEGISLEIRPVRNLENNQLYLGAQVPGFEFVYQGEPVGLLNEGRIGVRSALPEELQQVIASVASAILLRSELETDSDL